MKYQLEDDFGPIEDSIIYDTYEEAYSAKMEVVSSRAEGGEKELFCEIDEEITITPIAETAEDMFDQYIGMNSGDWDEQRFGIRY
jgi:hypothetical protein